MPFGILKNFFFWYIIYLHIYIYNHYICTSFVTIVSMIMTVIKVRAYPFFCAVWTHALSHYDPIVLSPFCQHNYCATFSFLSTTAILYYLNNCWHYFAFLNKFRIIINIYSTIILCWSIQLVLYNKIVKLLSLLLRFWFIIYIISMEIYLPSNLKYLWYFNPLS